MMKLYIFFGSISEAHRALDIPMKTLINLLKDSGRISRKYNIRVYLAKLI